MDSEDRIIAIAFVLVLAIQISIAIWWIPQKWGACQRLYNNLPAQIVCLSAHA